MGNTNTFMTQEERDKHAKIKSFTPEELTAYKDYKQAAWYNSVAQYITKTLEKIIDWSGYTCEFLIVGNFTEDKVVYIDSVGLIYIQSIHVKDLIRVIQSEVQTHNKSCFIHTRDRGSGSYYVVVTIK